MQVGVVALPKLCYPLSMNHVRPLCIAENNTCLNLAGIKERRTDGTYRYHTRCDKHRRRGHDARAFRNPESKRYIPLDRCVMCVNQATERHRIISGSDYSPDKVLTLCKECHRGLHKMYDRFKELGYVITKT